MGKLIVATLTSQADAEAVKTELCKLAEGYGGATKADYLDLIGISGHYTDEKVGWRLPEIVNAEIKQVGENEFLVDLPEPKPVS
jgi:hypothetical protein